MGEALKSARMKKGLTLREAARLLRTDAAIVSKIENGHRPPTLSQLQDMTGLYGIDPKPLRVNLLAERIVTLLKDEPQAAEILTLAMEKTGADTPDPMKQLLREMESLKQMMGRRP